MNETIRRCYICDGEMVRGEGTVYRETRDGLVVFEHVPAIICTLCGQHVYQSPALDAIDRVLAEGGQPAHTDKVPFYDLAAVPVGRG